MRSTNIATPPDFEDDAAHLEKAITELLEELPARLRPAVRDLPGRLGGEFAAAERWVDRLSRVTLFYPLLHAEGLVSIDSDAARECCVAQALLVLHAFLDDRQLDGQLELRRTERVLAAWLLANGLRVLSRALPQPCAAMATYASIHGTYATAQLHTYDDPPAGLEQDGYRPSTLCAARAGLGLVATLALARASGCSPAEVEHIERAFEQLTFGLQWMDDLEDWRDDLRGGQSNLLLHELGQRGRHDTRQTDEGSVAAEFIRQGVFSHAMTEGRRALEHAVALFDGLGCRTLSGLVGLKVARVDRMQRRYARARADAIGTALQDRLQKVRPE